jgi:hypothetical protein
MARVDWYSIDGPLQFLDFPDSKMEPGLCTLQAEGERTPRERAANQPIPAPHEVVFPVSEW